ncbi:hypothetical protein CTO_0299 [Chlamydia trachomatis A2497]|uniref:Uncharacterized protein n=1 Tax=Chlamydia trachomatis serovar A (strain A2497) TaxID=580047 RepID=G4NNZ7_CHLT4|nr:hypothetical protein CTO_0299 [Chlamydia trachomatis A2497]
MHLHHTVSSLDPTRDFTPKRKTTTRLPPDVILSSGSAARNPTKYPNNIKNHPIYTKLPVNFSFSNKRRPFGTSLSSEKTVH